MAEANTLAPSVVACQNEATKTEFRKALIAPRMPIPLELLEHSLSTGQCLRLTLSRPVGNGAGSERIVVRPVDVRGEPHYQFAMRVGTQERHENLRPSDAAVRVAALFPSEFQNAHLFTADADYALRAGPDGTVRVQRTAATLSPGEAAHNRSKQYLIPEGVPCPFLAEIGVMTAAGKVRADRQHKFRQINRFLEFVDDVLPHLPAEGTLEVVDFGCGKSSLTFAVHHLLTVIHGRDVRIVGLDRNPHVIAECRRIAEKLGCFGLDFHVGDIASHTAAGKVHLAISLHACDTATDASLAKAVAWQADVILAAPCCQHEVATLIANSDLVPLLRHGILRERFAALATDAMRAELLESRGYRAQVMEFIDLEHTPKNLLIRAVRRRDGTTDTARHAAALAKMKRQLGIDSFALERELSRFSSDPAAPAPIVK